MGKAKTRAYLSARGYGRRGRGGLYPELCSRPDCGPSTYLKPNQTGWSGGVERAWVNSDKEEVGGQKHRRPDNAHAEPH